ncbi:MAG: T9SS type A sorting domain-containing protein [Melioribacteraceae bacterium]|nr:T9SS type A sorting domain-containing protein [Melioribacteraceae bacterium]
MSNGATQVDLTWTDNDGAQAADGFLILVNTTGTFADPVDGTPQADDTDLSDNEGQVNVAHGVETYSFTGLTPETQYFFKIYPYSNSGVAIDYKTDETVPSANATPTNLLLVENFDYVASTLLTDNGWTAHSASGTNPIEVNNGGLTYADYPSSGIGNAATLQTSGEAVHRTFPVTNSGVVYVSFLVNVSSTWTTSDYVFNLGNDPIGIGYRARLFLINGGTGDFEFGLSQSAATADVSTNNGYSYSTTYLLVLKYEIIDGSSNDEVSLFIFDSGVPIAEPVTPTLGPVTGTDLSALGSVALRQTYANTQLIIDGIRVATSWAQAPLPVELTSFTANVFDGKVNLRWATATEVDNYGFEIQRSAFSNQRAANWENIGFVEGHGNSNSPKNYEFTDSELPNCDAVSYRLKQIDIDGAYEYSNEIEVPLENIPAKFELSQNYPNPFNPVTKIQFALPQSEIQHSVSLRVYDIIGREVAVLVNESKEAGIYEVEFDATKLSSGLYFYSLSAAGKTITKKMMLLR